MKRCKTCGTTVHIESNTCPSCGGHSFEVMDVKVCPLCGKVNAIESGFCEYCGKSFDGFSAGGYGEGFEPLGAVERYGEEEERRDPAFGEEEPFPRRRPVSEAERAMLRYLTLRPEISTDGKEKKYAYYVSEENVPIVILPTFETDREKNIKVEVMLVPDRQPPEGSVVAREEREEEGTRIQLPRETRKAGDLFTERKVSFRAQVWISLLLSLLALGALVSFFLPFAGTEGTSGFSLLLGMIGYHEGGAALVELLKAGGLLGRLTYVALLVLFTLLVLSLVLNLCFLRHARFKKVLLVVLWVLTLAALVLFAAGNAAVLEVPFGKMGLGVYLMPGFLAAEILLNLFLYDR